MSRRAGILLVVAFAASILAVFPVQAKATGFLTDYQPVSSLIGNASAVTLNITAQTNTTVTFSWTLSRDEIPGYDIVVGYQLFMSSTGINGQYVKVWSTSDNQRKSTSVDGLAPGQEYCFYLVANGLAGDYNSNIVLTRSTQTDDAGGTLAASHPSLSILSPTNTSYAAVGDSHVTVPLTFEANVTLSWVAYSLDGGANATGLNGTSIELPVNSESLTLYANDTSGNWAVPVTVYFTVAWNGGTPPQPFPWLPVAVVSVVVAAVVAVAAVVYVKKRGVPRMERDVPRVELKAWRFFLM